MAFCPRRKHCFERLVRIQSLRSLTSPMFQLNSPATREVLTFEPNALKQMLAL
jgi:hypothetical protein